jgi:hypothetical protein
MSTSQPRWEASRLEEVQAPSLYTFDKMWKMLRYYWIVARGYRLNPWKSPYLRWRFETFLGPEAAGLDASKFFHLMWKYRDQLERFVDWAAERRRFQRRRVHV